MSRLLICAILYGTLASGFPHFARDYASLLATHNPTRRSTTVLGDLSNLADDALSAVGQTVKSILTGDTSALANSDTYAAPGPLGSDSCAADQCCVWHYIASDMASSFHDSSTGQCNALARQAIRFGFHDAAAWDETLTFGGADGSILTSGEISRDENRGMADIFAQMGAWYTQYQQYGVTRADLIQMGALTATVVCPGGPRIRAVVGRTDSPKLPPSGLLPSAFSDARTNINLFAAKTFTASDLVALVGAHSVSQQFFTNTTLAGASQDSTDGVWDTTYYKETASSSTPPGVYKFPSDTALAADSQTSGIWQTFGGSLNAWQAAYASAYFRMSLLGVQNINSMTECSPVLPLPR